VVVPGHSMRPCQIRDSPTGKLTRLASRPLAWRIHPIRTALEPVRPRPMSLSSELCVGPH
jgi:hypothetical protein